MNNMYNYLTSKAMRKQAAEKKGTHADYGWLPKALAKMTDIPDRDKIGKKLDKKYKSAFSNSYYRNFFDKTETGKKDKETFDQAVDIMAKGRLPGSIFSPADAVEKAINNPDRSIRSWLMDQVSRNKGAIAGGLGSMAVVAPVAYSLSRENKLRNAALWGILSGILGTAGGAAYDKYMA